ncbi:MAG: hypothetical protein GY788_07485 [bacterium]|nr:hypothetical protein [bacterium]
MALSVACSLGTVSGPVTVEAEEDAARVATVTIHSAAAANTFVGQSVTVTYSSLIFSGVVNSATANTDLGQVTLNCSDLLQNVMEAKTEAQLLALIPGGRYSSHVFGDREDGWQQALDILSTWPGSIHLSTAGTPVVQAWSGSPATVPVHVVGTAKEEALRLRDLTNKVVLTFQVRYTRRHHREHGFGWDWGHADFCEWYLDSHSLPLREMIQSAAEGAGWALQDNYIDFDALPDTAEYVCGGAVVGFAVTDEAQNALVVGASWTAVRRWSQTVTETYQITVQSAGSIAGYGEQLKEDGATYQEEYSDDSWDQDGGTATPGGGGWSVDAIGDHVSDEITRAEADAAIECKIAQSATRIIETHRRSSVTYTIPCDPSLDLDGSVMQYVHNIDPAAGRATTTVKKSTSGAGTLPTIAAPSVQDTAPAHEAPGSSTTLPTRIGGTESDPPYDADWVGYTGNQSNVEGTDSGGCTQCAGGTFRYEAGPCEYPTLAACTAANPSNARRISTAPGAEVYPDRFRVVTPDIEDEARDEVAPAADESTVSVTL